MESARKQASKDATYAPNIQLKNTQSQLVESKKMAALGGLVAGVAHEINTPLGVSITASTHFSDRLKRIDKMHASGQLESAALNEFLVDARFSVDILTQNLNRASELIRNFKKVDVDNISEAKHQFELKVCLLELVQSLQPELGSGSHSVSVLAAEMISLNGYPGVVVQIMSNLIMNSVTHGFKGRSGGEIKIQLRGRGKTVYIDYEDNGCGLNAEQRERVFEPFYTTARATGGSGLGMAITFNLASNKLGGGIRCLESSKGAHFEVFFPK